LKKRTPYNPIQNIEGLTPADINSLWQDMKQVLDTEMPEEKERRRFFAWLFRSKVLFTLSCVAALTAMFVHIRMADIHHAAPLTLPLPDRTSRNSVETKNDNQIPSHTQKQSTVDHAEKSAEQVPVTVMESPILAPIQLPAENEPVQQLKSSDVLNQVKSPVERTVLSTQKQGKTNNRKIQEFKPVPQPNSPKQLPLIADNSTTKTRKVDPVQPSGFSIPVYRSVTASEFNLVKEPIAIHPEQKKKNGFTAGLSINMNVPVSSQEMSRTSMTGEKSSALDYLPSVYAGYHFNDKWSIEGEFQFVSPQYTPQHTLSSKWSDVTAIHYKEQIISLNKLYYYLTLGIKRGSPH